MTGLASLPDILGGVSTLQDRLIVTVGLLVTLLVVGWLARITRARFGAGSESLERVVNAVVIAVLLGVSVVIGAGVLSLWEVSVFALMGITDPILVLTRAVLTVGLLLGVYVFTGVVNRFIDEFAASRPGISEHQTELTYRVTQVSLYVLAFIVAFGLWEVNLGGVLVGAGFLGIVVGLAARQTLGSLIAGFVLMFARPFEIGDWVKVGDREGIVTEISIVNTRIQTFDGEYAMIPNDVVSSNEIINRTRKGRLRIQVDVGVDYDTDLEHAVDVAHEAMNDVDDVLTVPQPQVVLKEFADSAIVLGLRAWIDKPSSRRRWRARTSVIAAVKEAFEREGIKIPFPQRELMGRTEEGGVRVVSGESTPLELSPDGADE